MNYRYLEHYFKCNVFCSAFPYALLGSIYTALLVLIHRYCQLDYDFKSFNIVTTLTLVTGLMLVFKTNSAYDRYWESSKQWASIMNITKNLSRCIFIHVQKQTHSPDSLDENTLLSDKKDAIRYLLMFPFAVFKKLRNNGKIRPFFSKDPIYLIPNIDKSNFTNIQAVLKNSQIQKYPSFQRPRDFLLSEDESWKDKVFISLNHHKIINNPILILKKISEFLYSQIQNKTIETSLANQIEFNGLNLLSDAYHACVRISLTRAPIAYLDHLQHLVMFLVVCFPFTIVIPFGWGSVPISLVVNYGIIGVYKIPEAIENPFGDDQNDLPLEIYVESIEKEVNDLMGN